MIYGENITSPIQNELEDFELFHFHDMINFFAYSVMSVGRFWIINPTPVGGGRFPPPLPKNGNYS